MTNEENYHFDVTGYLIVPGVLTPDQLKTCNEALDQLETLMEQLHRACPPAPL